MNRPDFEGNPAEGATRTAALAPGQADFPMLSAPPRIFFGNLLHRLNRQMQGALPRVAPLRNGQKSNPERNRRSRSNTLTDSSLQ